MSLAALGSAFIAQFGYGLKPCILCLWARVPYALLIIDAVTALLVLRIMPRAAGLFLFSLLLLCLVETGVSFFHIGVEQHWWSLPGGCPITPLDTTDPDAALKQLMATPQAACDKVGWSLLGMSITWWNTALAAVMTAYLAIGTARELKR